MTLVPSSIGAAPWERQRGESPIAWKAFATYRDMTPEERSFNEVAHRLERSGALIRRWAQRHQWESRVLAYDRFNDRLRLARNRKEVLRVQRRHISAGDTLLDKAIAAAQEVGPNELSTDQIQKWITVGTRIQRPIIEQLEGRPQPQVQITNIDVDHRELHIEQPRSELADYLDRHPERIPKVIPVIQQLLAATEQGLLPMQEEKDVTPSDQDPEPDLEAPKPEQRPAG